MSKTLIINGTAYDFPSEGQEPPFGEQIDEWAKGVTDALAGIVGEGDITTTTFNPLNNVSSPQDVTGFVFDNATIQSFVAEYSIVRTIRDISNAITFNKVEMGTLRGAFDGTSWVFSQVGTNITDTKIFLSLLDTGQMQYTSSTETIPTGGSHNCKMEFKARAFIQ